MTTGDEPDTVPHDPDCGCVWCDSSWDAYSYHVATEMGAL